MRLDDGDSTGFDRRTVLTGIGSTAAGSVAAASAESAAAHPDDDLEVTLVRRLEGVGLERDRSAGLPGAPIGPAPHGPRSTTSG